MKKTFVFLALLLSYISCVTPYEPYLKSDKDKLVVAAILTNKPEKHCFQLSKSASYNGSENSLGALIGGAKMWITDNEGIRTDLNDIESGLFETPANFRAVIGKSYQLTIVSPDGKTYISSLEKMLAVPSIDKVSADFKYDANLELSKRGLFELYIDTTDPANAENYYYWNWRQYKRITACDRYSRQKGQAGTVFFERPCCETFCWEYNICVGCINIGSDALLNGKLITKQPIGTVGYDSKNPLYYIMEQYSLSKGAYNFWKTLKEQTKNVGGIFDTTPSTIRSNIANVKDPNDTVIGYFQVSAMVEKIFILDRSKSETPYPPALADRSYEPEVCMKCEEKPFRTTIMPTFWTEKFE